MSAKTRFSNDLRYRATDHPGQTFLTPAYALDPIRADLGGTIELDPCTTTDNPTGAGVFWTVEDDGLSKGWGSFSSVFVNPPYGKAREPWVERCIETGSYGWGTKIVLLIPAATDTRIWQRAADMAHSIVFVKGRLKFGTLRPNRRQHAASHPSSILGWHTDLTECESLGFRVTP